MRLQDFIHSTTYQADYFRAGCKDALLAASTVRRGIASGHVLTIAALLLSFSLSAQEPMTWDTFDSTEVYTMQYPTTTCDRPEAKGTGVMVRASKSGKLYEIWMPLSNIQGLKPGDTIRVVPYKPK